MQNDELERKTGLSELEQITADIRNKLAKEHNWSEQERHWQAQERHWRWIAVLGFVALAITSLAKILEVLQ